MTTTNNTELITISNGARSVADVIEQRRMLGEHMKSAMKDGVHFGTVPGCGDKPCLFKPGAEYLLFIFNLSCSFRHSYDYNFGGRPGHLRIESICTLTHRPTGVVVAEGSAICSTMEAKYRYRTSYTKNEVPKEFWTARDKTLLGGPQYDAKKGKDETGASKWYIVEQVEYENPSDYYNTVIKMADKRAIVAAVLYATAASDTFTQDLDDNPGLYQKGDAAQPAGEQKPRAPSAPAGDVKLASPPQLKLINFELDKNNIHASWVDDCLAAVTGQKTYTSRAASALIEALKKRPIDNRLNQFVGAPAKDDDSDTISDGDGYAEII